MERRGFFGVLSSGATVVETGPRPRAARFLIVSATIAAMAAGALLILLEGLRPAGANLFVDRPIRFIVGFGVGGPTDIIGRSLGDQLGVKLNTKVIVENRTGASGNAATQAVATAPADGQTLLIGASPLAVNPSLFPDFPVKYGRDLVAVAPIGATANVLVVSPSLNTRTLPEFIALARGRPGALTYATLGMGSSSHLAGIAFERDTGVSLVPVGYRGGGEAAKDLLGGHVQAWFAPIPAVLDLIRSGQLVALATTGPERVSWLPETPTISELGFKGFDVRLWIGLFAPSAIPGERMKELDNAVAQIMEAGEMQALLDSQGITRFKMSRSDFDRFVLQETDRWKGLLQGLPR